MMYDREKAIENFRTMWEWMAKKTEFLKRKVTKIEYFREHNFDVLEIPMHYCFLCEYADEQFFNKGGEDECEYCPINFGYDRCTGEEEVDGTMRIYDLWYYCPKEEWEEAARLCREIARLPEKGDV
jgi:hypothetical protein